MEEKLEEQAEEKPKEEAKPEEKKEEPKPEETKPEEAPKEEPKTEEKKEVKPEEIKKRSNFRKWLKGKNKREYIENVSFVIIVISGILVALGIGLGSFIQGTILIASLGSFFVMFGIVIYIISQFIEVEHG